MNGLEALKELRESYAEKITPVGNQFPYELEAIEKELEDGKKNKKFFEIIKSHAKENKHFRYLLYMAKYWEENEVEVTKELLENYDFPYTVEEFNFLKEALE